MTRSDRRRSGKTRSNNNRERTEKNERVKAENKNLEKEHSERRHESRGSASYERRQERRRSNHLNQKENEEKQNAIRAFKENLVTCEICGEVITDIANAITNKGSGNPVHFDCVLNKLSKTEKISQNEKLAYIGQGRFAVLYFENPHEKKFTIRKVIEWEPREAERGEWRKKMAGLFSQVK